NPPEQYRGAAPPNVAAKPDRFCRPDSEAGFRRTSRWATLSSFVIRDSVTRHPGTLRGGARTRGNLDGNDSQLLSPLFSRLSISPHLGFALGEALSDALGFFPTLSSNLCSSSNGMGYTGSLGGPPASPTGSTIVGV